jgi:hypothetical protein
LTRRGILKIDEGILSKSGVKISVTPELDLAWLFNQTGDRVASENFMESIAGGRDWRVPVGLDQSHAKASEPQGRGRG